MPSPQPGQLCPHTGRWLCPEREGPYLGERPVGHRQEVSVEWSPSSPCGSPFRGRDTFYEGSWLCLKVFVCKKCDLGYSWRCDLGLSGWDVDHGPCDQVSSVFPEVMITHCPAGRVESAPQPSPMGAHAHPWQCLCLQTSCLLRISCSPGVRYFPLLKLLSELLLVPSEMLGCSGTRCGCGHLLNVGCGHLLP